jgi:hypothetical protein
MERIFTACHGTQLLVIQHLRRHLQRPPAREFLIWHPMDGNPTIDRFMTEVVAESGFDDTLDVRDFQSLLPRTQGALTWGFESVRRLRSDAKKVRAWMKANGIDEESAELWADEPLHFYVPFARGLLTQARHVKIPHCFNLEDCTSASLKAGLEQNWKSAPWAKRLFFLPWQSWASGVDMRMQLSGYDSAYTFASRSCWSVDSVDASSLITLEAFADTYEGLPQAIRADVEAQLASIRAGSRPLIFLLLFGMGDGDGEAARLPYQRAIARIFSERATDLRNCTVAVKWHPGALGRPERIFADWLRANIPAKICEITHPLNLEFILPQLRPDYVLAGVCGSLPIVRDLKTGKAIAIQEMVELELAARPAGQRWMPQFLQGIEVW